jgi:hypothetical protein
MSRPLILSSLLLLSACARTEEASMVPPDGEAGYNLVEQVRRPEQDDGEVALGQWRRGMQEDAPVLEFGPEGTAPLFSIRCDERRGVLLQRHGDAPVGDLPMMLLQIGGETRRLAVTTVGTGVPMLRAAVPPSDALMERLATVNQPLIIRIGDAAPLVLPTDPSIGAFVRGCASGETAAAAAAAAAGDNAMENAANAQAPASTSPPANIAATAPAAPAPAPAPTR